MESQSLERASQYLNNLLLARGLLSNGKPIDFARPNRRSSDTDATMARVINLVHDLVLRRDQDADEREALTMHIRQSRAAESERVLDFQRLQDKNIELARAAAAAESQERTLKANMRKAEAQVKELKEQMLKMKSMLDQVRAKCLSDVRKRDVELDKLKAHLASMQRGRKDLSGMKINTINLEAEMNGREMRNGQNVDASKWSLEQETNDFLAALVNETSAENVSLRRIITDTLAILRDLTGLEEHHSATIPEEEEEDGIGIPGQYRKSRRKAAQAQEQAQVEAENLTSCDELAQVMTEILEHCQSILKDPSFVPIEEVQARDAEIIKLRLGWEKMADRWKEAVTMMDNWRKRKVDFGEAVPRDELCRLEFGKSVATLPNGQPVFADDDELSSILYESTQLENDKSDPGEASLSMQEIEYPELPPNDKIEWQAIITTESNVLLEEPSPKRRASLARKAGLHGKPIRPLQSIQPGQLNRSPARTPGAMSPVRSSGRSGDSGLGCSGPGLEVEDGEPDENANDDIWADDTVTKSRIPRMVSHMSEIAKHPLVLTVLQTKGPLHKMTVNEKLAAVEAEALQAQKNPSAAQAEINRKRKHTANGGKTRRAARRRSTLSPEELAELMRV
jgi:hypothetical protein